MTGRRVDVPAESADRRGRGRWVALGLGTLTLVALGIAIGSRIARGSGTASTSVTVTVAARASSHPSGKAARRRHSGYARTRQGAVTAASAYISALDGPALLDAARVRSIVRSIASARVRDQLASAYVQAATQTRERLGVDTVPAPLVILRAAPVGYRVQTFTPRAATISIWRVGIVGSGATAQPEQSWRTETVSVVWEDDNWKVVSLASEPGPTPPLAATAPSTPVELFTSIPRFEEFSRVAP